MGMIQDEWLKFSSLIIPKNAPPAQYTEMEKAFFAGASVALTLMQQTGRADITEEQGVKLFQALINEIQSFSDHQMVLMTPKGTA